MVRMIVIALVLFSATFALAQEGPKPEQLKRMYDDALVQLRSAQDRKNELANENETLKAKVTELNKQVDAARAEVGRLQANAATFGEQTYAMRARLAAWEEFLKRDGKAASRWNAF